MSRIFLFLVVFLRPGATDTLGVIVTSSNLKTSNRTADGIVDHADMPVGRLSEFGKRVKTVVIAALQPGGVCKHGNGDWRATLPRYIARSLGSQAKVLIWEAQVAARHEGLLHDCRVCDETESPAELTMFSCFDWFSAGSVREADLVLVLGSGYRTCKSCIPKIRRYELYGELQFCFDQTWVGASTKFIHIPVSRDEAVLDNRVAKFDVVVKDSKWVKPLHMDDLPSFRRHCLDEKRANTLMYIARYHQWKGQLDFVKDVDPKLMQGFKLELFSSKITGADMVAQIREVAKARGIDVLVHDLNATRDDLLQAMCRAKGTVHYARMDANPRVVYESVLAGLPVFVSEESRVPRIFRAQQFVFPTKRDSIKPNLNNDFKKFMEYVKSASRYEMSQRMDEFVSREMLEHRALSKICARLGICDEELLHR